LSHVSNNHCSTTLSFCSCGLEPAARKFLSAPPTSVASEQLISAAGQIYSDRRKSLLGENAEKLLFLAYNIRLLILSTEVCMQNQCCRTTDVVSDIVDWSVIMGLSRNIFFSCICYFMLLRHLQIIIVITNKFVYAIHCTASQTEALNVIGLYRSLGQWQFFYFSFSAENVGSFYFLYFSARKWNCFFGTFYFSAEKRKSFYGRPLTTTQGIRLRRRVDVFSTTSDTGL